MAEEILDQFKDLISHIDLFINNAYKFTFAYPVDVPEAMSQLHDHLLALSEEDDVTDIVGAMVQEVAYSIKDLTLDEIDIDTKHRMVFLFCSFMLQMSEVNDQPVIATETYRMNIRFDDLGNMTVEMCDTIPNSIH